jgi:hypothetical protein
MAAGTLSKSDAKTLQGCAERIHGHKASMNTSVIEIGRDLDKAREVLKADGTFLEWVEETCQFSQRTAYNYLSAYELFGSFKRLEHIENETIFMLARCKPAAIEAKRIATEGGYVDADTARELVANAKAPQAQPEPEPDLQPLQVEIVDDSDEPCDDSEPHEADDDLGPSVPTHTVPTPSRPHPEDLEGAPGPALNVAQAAPAPRTGVINGVRDRVAAALAGVEDLAPYMREAIAEFLEGEAQRVRDGRAAEDV